MTSGGIFLKRRSPVCRQARRGGQAGSTPSDFAGDDGGSGTLPVCCGMAHFLLYSFYV